MILLSLLLGCGHYECTESHKVVTHVDKVCREGWRESGLIKWCEEAHSFETNVCHEWEWKGKWE